MQFGKTYTQKKQFSKDSKLLVIPTDKKVVKRKIYDDVVKEAMYERTFNGKRYFVVYLGLKYLFLPCDELKSETQEIEVYKGEEVRTFQILKFKKNPVLPMYKAVLILNGKEYLSQSISCKPETVNKIGHLCNRVRELKVKNLILFAPNL
jgi:hypothetical protein